MTPSQRDVLAALLDGPKGRREIESLTGRDERTVRRFAMRSPDLIEKIGGPTVKYAVTEAGRAALGAHPVAREGGPDRPPRAPTPSVARGVSSTALSSKGIEEKGLLLMLQAPTPAMSTRPTHPQELFQAHEWMAAYAKRLERDLLAKIAEAEALRAELATLRRVSPEKATPLLAVEASPIVPVPSSAPSSSTATSSPRTCSPVVDRDVKPGNVLADDLEAKLDRAVAQREREKRRLVTAGKAAEPPSWGDWKAGARKGLAKNHRELREALERADAHDASAVAKAAAPAKTLPTLVFADKLARRELIAGVLRTLDEDALADLDTRADAIARQRLGPKAKNERLSVEKTGVVFELVEKEHASKLERRGVAP